MPHQIKWRQEFSPAILLRRSYSVEIQTAFYRLEYKMKQRIWDSRFTGKSSAHQRLAIFTKAACRHLETIESTCTYARRWVGISDRITTEESSMFLRPEVVAKTS